MALAAGNIAFVGFNADGSDNLAFVVLADIIPGEIIFFEDNEWNGTGWNDTNEGAFSWTTTNLVAAGTIVRIDNIGSGTIIASTGTATTPVSGRGTNRGIANSDEVIYAYQGTAISPTFITAIASGGFIATNGLLTNTGLTVGVNAIDLSAVDNDADVAEYIGIRRGQANFAAYLPIINNPNDWVTQDGSGDQSADGIAPDIPFSATAFTVGAAIPTVNLSISSNPGSEAEQTVITVTATASSAVTGEQTVSLAVAGTGITSEDYSLSNTTITIPDGQTTGTVTFTIQDDSLLEGTETAILTLSNPSAGISLGSTISQDITILDNESGSIVNLSVSSNAGSEAGTTIISVTATASSAVTGNQTVTLGVSGTDITTSDYYLTSNTIAIPDGQTSGSVKFIVADDAIAEGTETATLTISNPSPGLTLGDTISQNIAISNNDTSFLTKVGSATSATAMLPMAHFLTQLKWAHCPIC